MCKFKLVAISLLIAFATLTVKPTYLRAEENHMKAIFMDTFYGMAAGALLATAVSLAQDNPDWGENVGTGAAIGGIAGALFGIVTEMRYLAIIEDGHLNVGVPTIGVKTGGIGGDGTVYTAGIFKYRF